MTMPVVEANDGTVIAENCIYILPRNATLTIKKGVLHVVTPAPERALRRPIDTFFASLAVDQGERAVAFVLSGVGNVGSLGVKSVKEHGGLTLAQAEVDDEALFDNPGGAGAQRRPDRQAERFDRLEIDDEFVAWPPMLPACRLQLIGLSLRVSMLVPLPRYHPSFDRDGTFVRRSSSPSTIGGCAMTASRRVGKGKFANIAICPRLRPRGPRCRSS